MQNYWVCRARRWAYKEEVKSRGTTPKLLLKLYSLSAGEGSGIAGVAVKCVVRRRTTGGGGGLLEGN